MGIPKLTRYLKTAKGDKIEMSPSSVNLTIEQRNFLKRRNLNLSLIVRDVIDGLIRDEKKGE